MEKRTSEYWQERFQQLEEAQHDTSVQTMQSIEQEFRRTEQVLDGKINAWYQRFASNNKISMIEARRLLNSDELEEFKWDVQDYIKYGEENGINQQWMKELENASAKVHISRLEALKLQTQQELEKLYGNYHDSIDEHITNLYTSGYYHTAFEVQRGMGVGWQMQNFNSEKVSDIIHKPWAVDGRNFSDRVWTDKTRLINSMHDSLTRMCITGESPDRAIREISKNMKVSRSQATRIVQTESAAFSAKAQESCFSDLGVEEFQVVETLDSNTCDTCGEMDGKHFQMKDYKIGVTVPPFHPNCRGCTCPYFDDEFTIGERVARGEDGETYYIPENITYNEWKKQYLHKNLSKENVTEKEGVRGVEKTQETVIIKLSNEEIGALKRYKSFESYKINDALRNIDDLTKLSSEQQKIIGLLDTALSKMPTYNGDLVRTVNFSDWPDAEEKTKKFIEAFAKGKAFIPFITCGDPSLEITEQLVYAMEEAGAELIELGIPFSDPTAEGPVIQEANVRALSGGVTTDKIFDMVVKIRKKTSIPMVFMTYANVVFSYGTERFIRKAAEIGMDGLILPDVPFEEKEEFDVVCKQYGLELISLIAPTSHDRITRIAKEANGFVYCVSSLGVTGTRTQITTDIGAMVKLVKAAKDIPCAVGFGISTPEQAKKMAAQSDGAIVGSAIVKICAAHGENCVPYVKDYVKSMKDAVREA